MMMQENEKWVVYIYEVLVVVQDILVVVVDMEIGMCGYLFFGQDVFLEFYNVGGSVFEEWLKSL